MLTAPIGVCATTTCPNGELSMLRGASSVRIRFRTRPLVMSRATTCDSRSAVASATTPPPVVAPSELTGSRARATGAARAVPRKLRLFMHVVRAAGARRSRDRDVRLEVGHQDVQDL